MTRWDGNKLKCTTYHLWALANTFKRFVLNLLFYSKNYVKFSIIVKKICHKMRGLQLLVVNTSLFRLDTPKLVCGVQVGLVTHTNHQNGSKFKFSVRLYRLRLVTFSSNVLPSFLSFSKFFFWTFGEIERNIPICVKITRWNCVLAIFRGFLFIKNWCKCVVFF